MEFKPFVFSSQKLLFSCFFSQLTSTPQVLSAVYIGLLVIMRMWLFGTIINARLFAEENWY
ncbi:hypothetical protein PCS76_21715, partial [Acinetobacter baumannii]|nr:hypothetical protein [Acinetobacter baumannii]